MCVFADRERAGACKKAAYLRFLLGIFVDEFTSWSALEHGDWCGSKEDANKKIIKKSSRIRSVLLFFIGTAISMYGITVFIRRDFLTYLLLKSEFVFLDYGESIVLFYIDYFALVGLCIFVAHYLSKLLRKVQGQNNIQKDKQEKGKEAP